MTATNPTPQELRESARGYVSDHATEVDRQQIREWWAEHGIRSHVQAAARAARIEMQQEGSW